MADPFHYEKMMTLNEVYRRSLESTRHTISGLEEVKTPLYDYQITMVKGMQEYREKMIYGFVWKDQFIHGKIGIVGDGIGSGKTLTALAYLASCQSIPRPHPSQIKTSSISCELTPYSARYFYSHPISEVENRSFANLIIVPHSLFHEWKNEIQCHTTMRYVAIETRRMIRGDTLMRDMIESSFVITTNKCYKYVHEYAQQHQIQWNQIIIDEASSIYMNSSDPPLQFQFLWLMTHQWIPLLFKSASFHRASLYHLCEQVSSIDEELKQWLEETHCSTYEETLVSSGFLKDYLSFHHPARHVMVLRNRESAIRHQLHLPLIQSEKIHCRPNVSLSSLMSYYLSRQMEPVIHSEKIPHLFQSLTVRFCTLSEYLPQQSVNKHALIQRKMDDNECVICLERCEYPTIVECCYHLYCGKCLLKSVLISGKCSTCRDHVSVSKMNCFGEILPEHRIHIRNKSELCLDIIRNHPSGRFIIYSAFDNIFYQLFEEIDRMGRKSERIENSLFSLIKTIRNFKQGSTQILFVSNVDTIRGVSLPFVTHLIFYHDQPSYEKKRLLTHLAQRAGRTQPLQTIHLYSEIQV